MVPAKTRISSSFVAACRGRSGRANLRVAIALTFAVPAALAGYQAAYELSGHTMTSDLWREIVAVMNSIAVGATAWARFAVLSPAAPGMFRRRES